MLKFLPAVLVVALVAFCVLYLPIRREIAYALHISGDNTTSCCDANNLGDGSFDENASIAFFNGNEVDYPKTSLAETFPAPDPDSQVLGTTLNNAGEEKWIEVSLDQQKVRAWEGNKLVMEFPISSGRWAPTPKGDFRIWLKTRFQSMKGGSPALGTYYNLPNVPNNMFFYQGYALHGAYWHNNFGHPMSHGCVNEPLADAAKIFEWAGPKLADGQNSVRSSDDNPGTRVFIH